MVKGSSVSLAQYPGSYAPPQPIAQTAALVLHVMLDQKIAHQKIDVVNRARGGLEILLSPLGIFQFRAHLAYRWQKARITRETLEKRTGCSYGPLPEASRAREKAQLAVHKGLPWVGFL